ncbi:peptidoglycan-binding protein [Micromonospora deserti]|uniref:Peptidoglycan-binding protein n=1 Tax=Micromonospora deserti TaxID=2070366 RepID=A0A2W2CUQ6_9ACTN|nr:peptidoglycan-binding protein [Micromonospora deserti]PZF91697.1 peptidoglycan-binding protein [Micromonospora deserti]
MRGKVVAAVLGAAAVAVAGAATLGLGGRGTEKPAADRTGPATTVAVTRETLVESASLAGELSYGKAVPLASTAAGTVTWLPEPGATVRRGSPLLRADELPVVLLYGPLPMYRPLTEKLTGPDVLQFERNLSALGYDGFTVDDSFSTATTAAVKRWQKELGRTETGTVDKDQVVYAPGPVRIAERLVRVGASAAADVVSYTGSTRLVTVPVGANEAAWAAKGTAVTVTLPDGKSVAGKVAAVADEAAAPTSSEDTAPTVDVTVSIADQKALGTIERGPVTVKYTVRQRKDVLTVPVAALLALAEGGYGLEVVSGGSPRIVPVKVGLFADGRVEVTGDGLDVGTTVGIPE